MKKFEEDIFVIKEKVIIYKKFKNEYEECVNEVVIRLVLKDFNFILGRGKFFVFI